jgi:hypothetical protein
MFPEELNRQTADTGFAVSENDAARTPTPGIQARHKQRTGSDYTILRAVLHGLEKVEDLLESVGFLLKDDEDEKERAEHYLQIALDTAIDLADRVQARLDAGGDR